MAISLGDGASIAIGLILVVIAGILNGSWNASFSPYHGLAVGRTTLSQESEKVKGSEDVVDLSYHHAWVLFQIYAALLNILVCLWWAGGPERVQYIVQESSAASLALVVVFSILWGIGSVGFGWACQVAGVGLGTNLCMGVIMVLGTFLPLCLDGAIATPAGGIVVFGLLICCGGLVYSVQSLQRRDSDEKTPTPNNTAETSVTLRVMTESFRLGHDDPSDAKPRQGGNSQEESKTTLPLVDETHAEGLSRPKDFSTMENPVRKPVGDEYSTLYKVSVCVVAGLFATQLQFAFVFGDELVALAEDSSQGPGSTPSSGTSAVIWLFAISLGAPVSIVYGIYSSPRHISISHMWQCPWYRHVLIVLTTSIPWVAHIHLYGYSNTLLPSDLAASVAWPCLMMMTVVAGMLWSVFLGEWKYASTSARRLHYHGLAMVLAGVVVIMVSMAIP